MIDPISENLIHFPKASKFIPGNPSLCALHRWRLSGVRGAKLDTLLVGGKRFTSREAIARFIAQQNHDESPTPTFTPAQRRVQAETANRILEAAGV